MQSMLSSGSAQFRPRKLRICLYFVYGLLLITCLGLAIFVVFTTPKVSISAKHAVRKPVEYFAEAPFRLPLVFEQDLRNLERPMVKLSETTRTDHQQLAQEAFTAALTLRGLITFRIIVIAWKRKASLDRLMQSLLSANYHGFTIHLDFHMDGEGHPKVVKYIEEFQWPHGRIRVNRHADRVGLERTIMESWQPVSDTEYAFFFEDDIAVSPRFFEYSIFAIQKYVLPGGVKIQPSVWTTRLVGISLNTPRYNEIAIPGRDWTPQLVLGDEETQFLFQLPCSWGALYFPWAWRDFLSFYLWRRQKADEEVLHVCIPDSATRWWRRSWKKYLIEWMYMRGSYMLYPSLPNQLSFSTHHREPGEHTDVKPEEHLVDELGVLVLDYFTVPLVGGSCDDLHFERLLAEAKPLRELPVVSFHHELVKDVYSLAQLGARVVTLMEKYGWDHGRYRLNPNCMLDDVTFPIFDDGWSGEKYLLFASQLSLGHQLNALQNAAAYAKVLNRTLVVPPLVAPKNVSLTIPASRIIELNVSASLFVPMITLEEFAATHNGWIDRIVHLVPWSIRKSKMMNLMDDELLNRAGLIPASVAVLHVFSGYQDQISRSFGGCHDRVLAFRHLFGSFDTFTKPEDQASYRAWVHEVFSFSAHVQRLKNTIFETFGGPLVCVVYSRGEVPTDCGRDISRTHEKTEEMKVTMFRSCHASVDRTIEYVIEDSNTIGITPKSIYVMAEMPIDTLKVQKLSTFIMSDIMRQIDGIPELADLPIEFRREIGMTLEGELCGKAAFFLGNKYSSNSAHIAFKRRSEGLPLNILGQKAERPSQNKMLNKD